MTERTDILILGAGITGLDLARRLTAGGKSVLVLENTPHTGGLARTLDHAGHPFDLGGHRLYFGDKTLESGLTELLGPHNLETLAKKSSICLDGDLLPYPPSPFGAIPYLFHGLFGLPGRRKAAGAGGSLKDWLLSNFNEKIHDVYFRDYTLKVWGLPTEAISASWADRRIGRINLLKLAGDVLLGRASVKENVSTFKYPRGGIGALPAALEKAVGPGGKVLTGAGPLIFKREGARLASLTYSLNGSEREVFFDRVVSTIPVNELARLLGLEPPARYRELIVFFALLEKPAPLKEHWVYFADKDLVFSRACELVNWDPAFRKGPLYPMTFELFCDKGDALWNAPDAELARRVGEDLKKVAPLAGAEIKDYKAVRVEYAYPLLHLDYEKSLAGFTAATDALENLSLAGRNGTHSYFDIEECLKASQDLAKELCGSRT